MHMHVRVRADASIRTGHGGYRHVQPGCAKSARRYAPARGKVTLERETGGQFEHKNKPSITSSKDYHFTHAL